MSGRSLGRLLTHPFRQGRLAQVSCVVALVLSAMALLLLAGAYRDDHIISADLGKAQAEVLSAGRWRSAIAFRTPDGVTRNPKLGVLYPTNLTTGQRINVEYARSDPDLVRVAGRDATVAIIPVISVIFTVNVLAGALVVTSWWLRRRRGNRAPSTVPAPDISIGDSA